MSKDQFAKIVGEVLREVREERGISQEEFADKVGMHRTYIGMIERGKRNITVFTLIKISESFDINPEVIISRIHKKYVESL
jgi:transcriptional regulator with XRE-family HTH domain